MTCWVQLNGYTWVDLAKAICVEHQPLKDLERVLVTDQHGAMLTINEPEAATAWAEFERYVGRERIKSGHDRDLDAEAC